ncbi:ABC transporter permease subunit (plasmid) [Rhizobium sp. CB3090]|uniref:ABC transporter permease subunit n=1 Tax=Rhizobium sp. CB3090 TaxID=3039156 RepID=UPI0024B168F7|nr:ABC transporter permease subunit [Rhizobium sp. CB3090]WFU11908.1 ABC transporter permease subunit [Rhizobium sp. CB3090]
MKTSFRDWKLLRGHAMVALQLIPLVILIIAFLILPFLSAAWQSVNGLALDFSRYGAIWNDGIYVGAILRSLQIALTTTIICIVVGFPIAYYMTALSKRCLALLSIVLLVPLFTAFLIRTYGWMVILGRRGVLNIALQNLGLIDQPLRILGTSTAVYIGLVHVLMPIGIFIMYGSMTRVDRSLVTAAQILGAHPVKAFIRVLLPMCRPAILSAAMLIFIISLGFYIAPALLGGPADTMISQLVVTQITTLLDFQSGYALGVILLIVTMLVLAIGNHFVPLEQLWAIEESEQKSPLGKNRSKGGRTSPASRVFKTALILIEDGLYFTLRRPAWLAPLLMKVALGLVVMFLLAPLAIIYVLSFSSSPFLIFPPPGFSLQWYEKFLTDPDWRSALFQSFKLGTIVASLALVTGTMASFALVRAKLPWKRVIFLLVLAPLMLPLILLALGLYLSMAKLGLLGSFPGLIIGHLLVCAPYTVVVLVPALRGLDRNIEHAASTLGAPPYLVVRKITLPLLLPAFIAAWLMAFLQSFDELLITLFLLGRQTQTLPIKMWSDIRIQLDPTLSAASSVIVTVVILCVVATQYRALLPARKTPDVSGA